MDSQEFLKGLTSASGASGVNTPIAALMPQWVQRRDAYRQTAKALLEKDPELLALGIGLTDLCKIHCGNDDELPKDAFDTDALH